MFGKAIEGVSFGFDFDACERIVVYAYEVSFTFANALFADNGVVALIGAYPVAVVIEWWLVDDLPGVIVDGQRWYS